MQLISNTISELSLGRPSTFLNLTLFPLIGKTPRSPDYITLRQAVDDKTAIVREVSEGGSVPELLLENKGKKPVLILEGEELIGAKQNRTANVTILAPPGKSLRIPVTCVEAGRWRYTSREFGLSEQMHYSGGRKGKMASVSATRRATGQPFADQHAVWADIQGKCANMSVGSATSAMADVYEAHATRVNDYVAAFQTQHGQVGSIFAIGEKVEGLEMFDCEATLADMLPKLIRSYAIDALEKIASHRRNPGSADAQAFIDSVENANVETYPGVGIGTEVRLTAPGMIAGGLVADARVVHLAAFTSAAEPDRQRSFSDMISRFRDRRRNRQA